MPEQNEIFDVKFLKGFLRRRKKLFLLISSVIFTASIVISFFAQNYYVSTATILIEGQLTEELIKGSQTGSIIEERLQSITQQILSRDKLLEIINQFGLYDVKNQENMETAIKKMRDNITIRTIRAEDLDKRAAFRGRLGTVAFTLSFQGKDPSVVQQVASRLTALYIEKNLQTKEQMTAQATAVLQARVNNLKEQAEFAGKRLGDFKKQHASELPESVPINLDQIFRLNNQLSEINARINTLENRGGHLTSSSSQNPSDNQVAGDPWIRLAQLRMQLESLQSKYSEKHPDVIKTKNEIQKLETRLGSSGQQQLNTKDSELQRQIAQRNEIERKIAELQRKSQMAPLNQSDLSKLTLEYDNAMKQYNDTMSKLAEAKLMKGIDETQLGERFIIIDEAALPQLPEKPQKNKIIFTGIFLSIFCGLFASILVENLDHSIKSPEQLQKITKLPILTVLPYVKTDEEKKTEAKSGVLIRSVDDLKNRAFNMFRKTKTS